MSSRFTAKLYQASSLLCLVWIAIPTTAFADAAVSAAAGSAEAGDTGTQGLAEIVVTANKVEESSSKVGLTIQTIADKALTEQHIATLQDLAESEAIFSTLMGEDVEGRRKFIEENALDVRNLDV